MTKEKINNILKDSYETNGTRYFCIMSELKDSKKKIDEKIYNYLNCDNISVIVDCVSKRFWLEKTWSGVVIHNYVLQYYKNLLKKVDIKYLYD